MKWLVLLVVLLTVVVAVAAQCEFTRVDCIASCGCIWCWDGVDRLAGTCAASNSTVCANYEPGACTWPPGKEMDGDLGWMLILFPMFGVLLIGIGFIQVWKWVKFGICCDRDQFMFDCFKC